MPKAVRGIDAILSSKPVKLLGYSLVFLVLTLVVFAPIFYVFYYTWRWWNYSPYTYDVTAGVQYQFFYSPQNVYERFIESLINSLLIAASVTLIDIGVGIPIGFFLVRRNCFRSICVTVATIVSLRIVATLWRKKRVL
mgnify:CR=1 FL=1